MKVSLEEAKSKIIIAGDSWGCGEWSTSGNGMGSQLLHPGLAQYFTELGHSVTNLSVGGFSNKNSIDSLKEFLSSNPDDYLIFWIQSDPIRDLRPFWRLPEDVIPYKTLSQEIKNHNGFENLCNDLMLSHYQYLNSLGVEINLIGGKRDINVKLLEGLNNLKSLVTSWVYLLVERQNHLDPFRSGSDYNVKQLDLDSFDTELRHKTVDELHYISLCEVIFEQNKIFHPDGQHPNREGHKVLFDFLVEELKL